jgi:hypothetical protein
LPTYCAQPATLKRVNAAAVTRASVFMAPSFIMTNAKSVTDGMTRPRLWALQLRQIRVNSAEKDSSGNFAIFVAILRARSGEQLGG